jgi:polyferredoxin
MWIPGAPAPVACPIGPLQTVLSTPIMLSPAMFMALWAILFPALLLIGITILLGRVFCSWVCPLGTFIDFVDFSFEKLRLRTIFERFENSRPVEFIRKRLKKYMLLAGFAVPSVAAYTSANPVFCTNFCPIRGICLGSLAGIELAMVPTVAGLSIAEKRFWCKYLCPIGAVLSAVSALNPFIKPKVNEEKCIEKGGCPEDCEDFHMDLCAICREIDDKKCERECNYGISLLDSDSLIQCSKCFDCYVKCDNDAVRINLLEKPAILRPFIALYNRIKGRSS